MRAPVRPIRDRWPVIVQDAKPIARFFRTDPATILDPEADPGAFRDAMSSIYVGGTIKITGSDRHPETDQLLLDTVDLESAHIVDIGASDGSTSLDLISRLDEFASYTIADLYITLKAVTTRTHTVFFDSNDTPVLITGRRLAAWPELSRPVAMAYWPLIARARAHLSQARTILLLNPKVQALIVADPRVSYLAHDIFEPWPGQQPTVIKVANLLRRLYFDDAELSRALHVLRDALPEGGHLMIVDNPRLRDVTPRAGIYVRRGDRLIEVAHTGEPEIGDLVLAVGHPSESG